MENKRFQRKIEDFTCENCGQKVSGDGYTNHCPNCLWSKHVDNNPGDRAATCGGLMEPISVYIQSGHYIIEQKCQRCSVIRRIKTRASDNMGEIIRLSSLT